MNAKHTLRCLFLLMLAMASADAPWKTAAADKLAAEFSVEVEPVVPAGFPLLLQLKIANTGETPIRFWNGGPSPLYPSARPFSLKVTDQRGRTRIYQLHNGQYEEGSGAKRVIETTQTLPAVSDPLSAGVYTLHVESRAERYVRKGETIETWPAMQAKPVTMTVVEDRAKLAESEAALLVQGHEYPFARHVAQVYGIDPVVKDWLRQLNSNNLQLARQGVGRLQIVRRLAPGDDERLKSAALWHIAPPHDEPDPAVLEFLYRFAGVIGTENSLDAVLIVANSKVNPAVRAIAVSQLHQFPGERAEKELFRLAADGNPGVQWASVVGLAHRGNRAAIQPLLEALEKDDPYRRRSAVDALAAFRDLPEVRSALTQALEHNDKATRLAAARALEREVDLDSD